MHVTKQNADSEIWEKLKSGDSGVFGFIYDQNIELLINTGLCYSNDKDFVEDCIHDLFLDLHRYRKNLSATDNVKLYLIKSLKRRVLQGKLNKSGVQYVDKISREEMESEQSHEDQIIGNETEAEVQKALRKAIEQLSERQKEGLTLRFKGGLSYPEIAKTMDVSVESARTIIYRGIKALREQMENEYISIQFLLFLIRSVPQLLSHR